MFYVVGYEDTRGEFEPKGVTENKKKAEQFRDSLRLKLYPNSRQWASIKKVAKIK